jgi:hypothetical protein
MLGGDGVITPTLRSAEQTTIGIFWGYDGSPGLGTPPRLYNQIARTLAEQQHNSVAENARLFALVNVAMADAGIACWEVKYRDNFWRPVLGIRQADTDGNPDTVADATWKYLGAPRSNAPGESNFTPPFPAYTSGHATFGAALFRTLANFYGRDDLGFAFTSDEFNGAALAPAAARAATASAAAWTTRPRRRSEAKAAPSPKTMPTAAMEAPAAWAAKGAAAGSPSWETSTATCSP